MIEAENGKGQAVKDMEPDIEFKIGAFREFLSDAAESSAPAENYIRTKIEHFQAEIIRVLSETEVNKIHRLQKQRAERKQAVQMMAG